MSDASLSEPARAIRLGYYQLIKRLPGGPRIVSEGDSWFQHPTEWEIIDWLYPNPGKKYYGIFDWGVGRTLEQRGVREHLWYDVVKLIIDRFNIMLQGVAKDRDHMLYVDLRNTLKKTEFVDEMHPTSRAARKLAAKIRDAIREVLSPVQA